MEQILHKNTWSLDTRAPYLTLVGNICHQSKGVEWLKSCTGAQREKTTLKRGCGGTHHSVLSHMPAPVQDFLQQQYVSTHSDLPLGWIF